MSSHEMTALQQEWITLQVSYDKYECHSLFIKLFNLALLTGILLSATAAFWQPLVILTVWLLDGIFKTFQQRTAERLLSVEKALQEQQSYRAMQFHRHWQETRPGTFTLMKHYIINALRPTVAASHLVCALISLHALL